MSAARPPMQPPELPGYTFERPLGSGGYSDVFLYNQQMPRRQVAVKVLLAESIGAAGRQQFDDEANTMAALSTHPYIVTIFHAAIAPGGNPFLVMEYYPRPNYSVRARTEQLSIAEVLRTGIQVASAIETAHRAGIVHRDIKPANILTSEYGRPGLTDFGIAATTAGDEATEAAGMSIPWSPPEVVSGSGRSDERSDIYSLAATVYTLLAGRSPFEVPGGSNRSLDLINRIEREEPPPTGRGDVPPSLERVLRQAMAKSPSGRPSTAAAFGRSLQEVEVEQKFAMTMLEVRDDGSTDVRHRGATEDEDGTRLKGPVVIHSQPPAGAPVVTAAPTGETVHAPPRTAEGTIQRRVVSDDGVISSIGGLDRASSARGEQQRFVSAAPTGAADEVSQPVATHQSSAADVVPAKRNTAVLVAAALLVLVIALVATRIAMASSDSGPGQSETQRDQPVTTPPAIDLDVPASPTGIRAVTQADGSTLVTWTAPDAAKGDTYLVTSPPPASDELASVDVPEAVLPPGSPPCFVVTAQRDGAPSEPASYGC